MRLQCDRIPVERFPLSPGVTSLKCKRSVIVWPCFSSCWGWVYICRSHLSQRSRAVVPASQRVCEVERVEGLRPLLASDPDRCRCCSVGTVGSWCSVQTVAAPLSSFQGVCLPWVFLGRAHAYLCLTIRSDRRGSFCFSSSALSRAWGRT